jgi:stage II sporulation protein D
VSRGILLSMLLVAATLAPLRGEELRVELFSGKVRESLTFEAGAGAVHICAVAGQRRCLVLEPSETARCVATRTGFRCACGERAEEFQSATVASSAPFRLDLALRKYGGTPTPKVEVMLRRVNVVRAGSSLRVIAPVDLETYVQGVLAGEAATLKSPPALRAMAVLARTWALHSRGRHRAQGFDFCSLTHCQFFRLPSESEAKNSPAAKDAVASTAGLVLKYQGQLVDSYYTAHCGGVTEAAGDVWPDRNAPYLKSVRDPYCARSEQAAWQQKLPLEAVAVILRQRLGVPLDGPLRDLAIEQKDASGRVRWLRLVGGSSRRVEANEFRYAVNRQLGWNTLKSSLYTLERRGDSLVFTGRGLGHGVGLCQAGAEQMGQMGIAYEKILAHYFPGTTVERLGTAPAERILSSEHFELFFPPGQEPWVAETLRTLERYRQELGTRANVLPARVQARTWETTEEFIRASGQPGWVAASNDGQSIQLQPLRLLKRKGILDSTLRHELTHLMVGRLRAPQVPRWFEEGLVLYLTGEQPGAGAAAALSGRSLEESVSHPRSEAEMKAAYARALERVRELARQRGEPTLWLVLQHPSAEDLRWLAGQQ